MNILYEDAAIVVVDKPAGLSSEEGVPAALREHWNAPDAFVFLFLGYIIVTIFYRYLIYFCMR